MKIASTGIEGDYLARTNSEASLSIEEVCAAMKNRGGFTGNYEVLQENIHQFFDEAAYQSCPPLRRLIPHINVQIDGIADNSPSSLIGIVPKTDHLHVKLEIRTQYAGSSAKTLKTPRVITSDFVLEEN